MSVGANGDGDRGSFLVGCIELAVAHINDPRDRLARQVGMLQGHIRQLCAELEARQPDEPQAAPADIDGDDDIDDEPISDDRYADAAAAEWFAERTGA